MHDCPNDPSNGYGGHNTTNALPCYVHGCDCAAALRKNAARYLWLRDEDGALSTFTAAYWNTSTPEQLDAAIDDAMAGD